MMNVFERLVEQAKVDRARKGRVINIQPYDGPDPTAKAYTPACVYCGDKVKNCVACGGVNFGGYNIPAEKDDRLSETPPTTWAEKERRVQWVLDRFTDGEKAYLYRMLNAQGITLSGCAAAEAKERK